MEITLSKELLNKINLKLLCLILIGGCLLSCAEYALFNHTLNHQFEFCLGSIVIVFSLISISIKNPTILSKSKFINQRGNYTMFIYIFHPVIISGVNFINNKFGLSTNTLFIWAAPIIVIIIAVASAMIFNKLLCFIKDKRKLKNRLEN